MKRIKDMGLSLEDIYKRGEGYLKATYNKYLLYVEDSVLDQCWARNKRKVGSLVFDKISIYTVFKFYINLGIVFRDKNKRYYTMEEAEVNITRRIK